MLAIERKNEILEKLRVDQRVLVSQLAVHYGVTEETIRRDLDKLEKEGYATKTYGGAIWGNSTKIDLSHTIRNKTNVDAKTAIAQLIANTIMDGDHLMLDDSSTSLFVAKAIKEKKNLTVISNSLEVCMELSSVEGFHIFSTGGRLKPDSLSLMGHQCHEMLRQHHVDKVILSCKGVDPVAGVTDSSDFHASTKKVMMASSAQAILIADYTKFNKISFVKIGNFPQFTHIFTNQKPSDQWLDFFAQQGIPCHYPK